MATMIEAAGNSTDAEQRSAEWAGHLGLEQLSNEDLSALCQKTQHEAEACVQNLNSPPVFGAADESEYKESLELAMFCLARVEAEMRSRGLLPKYEAPQVIVGS
jgi:hypothetical protein